MSFGDRDPRIPFASNALKIWEVRNFPLDFLGQVRNFPHAEFSPAEKSPYRIFPSPVRLKKTKEICELHLFCYVAYTPPQKIARNLRLKKMRDSGDLKKMRNLHPTTKVPATYILKTVHATYVKKQQ